MTSTILLYSRKTFLFCTALAAIGTAMSFAAAPAQARENVTAQAMEEAELEAAKIQALKNRELPSSRDITASVEERAAARERENARLAAEAEAAMKAQMRTASQAATAAPQKIVTEDLTAESATADKAKTTKAKTTKAKTETQAEAQAKTKTEAVAAASESDAMVEAESVESTATTVQEPLSKKSPPMMGSIEDAEDAAAAEVEDVEQEIIDEQETEITLDGNLENAADVEAAAGEEVKPRSKHKRWWGRPY